MASNLHRFIKLMTVLLIALVCKTGHADQKAPSSVTVPIDDFMRLRELDEKPSLTVIEEVSVTGTFEKSLKISITGSSSGRATSIDFARKDESFSLHNCSGSGLLHSNGRNLAILPQASRFKLSCDIDVRSWTQIQMTFLNSLFVRSQVTGGEAIFDGANADERTITLTKTRTDDPALDAKAEIAVVARHKISILPEESRFEYLLVMSNPNRNKRTFSLPLANGELIQNVRTSLETHEKGGALEIVLVPGENRVTISGRYTVKEFKAPLESAQNFLLIESHPMLQTNVTGPSRRISVQDVGLGASFAATRAYLLSANEQTTWTAKKLDVFSSLGYSVSRADFLFYVPRSGKSLVEAVFEINNQGTPEVPLEVPGRVTYLEIGGMPQVLSKDDKGRLLLQLPTGQQSVLVQYESNDDVSGLMASAKQAFSKPGTVLSNVDVKLALDQRWRLALGHGVHEVRSDWSMSDLAWSLAALVGAMILTGVIGFAIFARVAVSIGAAGLVFFMPGAGSAMLLLLIVGAIIRYREDLKSRKPRTRVEWVGASFAAVAILVMGINLLFNAGDGDTTESHEALRSSYSQAMLPKIASNMDQSAGFGKGASFNNFNDVFKKGGSPDAEMAVGKDPSQSSENDFQGLPARITIPNNVRVFSFSQGLIDSKSPVEMRAVLLNKGVQGFLMLMCLLGVGLGSYRQRRAIAQYLRLTMRHEEVSVQAA